MRHGRRLGRRARRLGPAGLHVGRRRHRRVGRRARRCGPARLHVGHPQRRGRRGGRVGGRARRLGPSGLHVGRLRDRRDGRRERRRGAEAGWEQAAVDAAGDAVALAQHGRGGRGPLGPGPGGRREPGLRRVARRVLLERVDAARAQPLAHGLADGALGDLLLSKVDGLVGRVAAAVGRLAVAAHAVLGRERSLEHLVDDLRLRLGVDVGRGRTTSRHATDCCSGGRTSGNTPRLAVVAAAAAAATAQGLLLEFADASGYRCGDGVEALLDGGEYGWLLRSSGAVAGTVHIGRVEELPSLVFLVEIKDEGSKHANTGCCGEMSLEFALESLNIHARQLNTGWQNLPIVPTVMPAMAPELLPEPEPEPPVPTGTKGGGGAIVWVGWRVVDTSVGFGSAPVTTGMPIVPLTNGAVVLTGAGASKSVVEPACEVYVLGSGMVNMVVRSVVAAVVAALDPAL